MPETATIAAPAGFFQCDRLASSRARRGAIFDATFLWMRCFRDSRGSLGARKYIPRNLRCVVPSGSRYFLFLFVWRDVWAKASRKGSILRDNFRTGVFLFVMEEKRGLASPAVRRRAWDKVEAGIGGCGSAYEPWLASCRSRRPSQESRPARRRRSARRDHFQAAGYSRRSWDKEDPME